MHDPTVVEATMILRVVEHHRRHGRDPEPALRRAGIDPGLLADRERLFSFPMSLRFYDATADDFGDRTVGLDIAREASPRDYGLLGLLWRHHPTLDAAFDALARYYSLFLAGSSIQVDRRGSEGTHVLIGYAHTHPGLDVFRAELLAAIYLHSLAASEEPWRPRELHLAIPARAPERFRELFGVDVQFEADVDRIVIDPVHLARPIPGADPVLLAHLLEAAETHFTRRQHAAGAQARILRLQGCDVDLQSGTVHRGDDVFALTTKEKALLEYFALHRNEVVTHEDLERDIWGIGKAVLTHAPAVAIRRLRQKIEPPTRKPVNLVTVFGEGWRLVVPELDRP